MLHTSNAHSLRLDNTFFLTKLVASLMIRHYYCYSAVLQQWVAFGSGERETVVLNLVLESREEREGER